MKKTVGILLAGGLSRRFGSPKAFAIIDGEHFYEKVHQALEAACDEVVIVTRRDLLPFFPEKLAVVTDLETVTGKGPLAGICTAMKLQSAEQYMVLPCDMPFIGPEEAQALKRLAAHTADVTAIETEKEKIPLFSLWNGNFAEELENAINNDTLSVLDFLNGLDTDWIAGARIHTDKQKFRNINRNIL